ncbi:hypothetical protein [Streptomyces morookaense]|uniref:Uncharacterized protein n=1 Tax=Streptomyces morookaense TaxID=1970 RepID=A0A7Y7B094_STRMO|nr:hypothetical protein [Streptomyces morookaense]NVK76639.1 hypothetical protein [Streptomyces morookaense]GHF08583.1 hypothetical protein GCM10010359_07290 [Streptomyces morookaense]
MIHISETLTVQTVEDFLTADELAQLNKIMDIELRSTAWRPAHQAEVLPAPADAEDILQVATARALPAIRRAMPSVRAAAAWGFTELGEGQKVPTHLDGIPAPAAPPRRIGRIGVTIGDAEQGGLFYIETTSSPLPWTGALVGEPEGYVPGTPLTRCLSHQAAAVREHAEEAGWLEAVPTSRWTAHAPAGVAVAYGAHLIHGVTPVVRGRVRKFVTDLTDRPASGRGA